MDSRIDEAIRVARLGVDVAAVHADVRGAREEARAAEAMARIEALPRAKNASYRSAQSVAPGACFEGTRTLVLEEIYQWAKDTSPEASGTLWLSGMAGMGKSAIACSAAERADKEGFLGANYFFSRAGDESLKSASSCFPTLAYQLAMFAEDFKMAIADELSKDPDIAHAKLSEQLEGLISRPLRQVDASPSRVVLLVLDGLDECEDKGAQEIITLILSQAHRFPFTLKFLVTSRPEPHLVSAFADAPSVHRIALHELNSSSAADDIHRYLHHHLTRLPETLGIQSLTKTWISEDEIRTLSMMAGQLFVYAATLVRFVGDDRLRDPRYQLDIILGTMPSSSSNPYGDLDALYTQILTNALSSRSPQRSISRYQLVVGAITLPVHLDETHRRRILVLRTLENLLGVAPGEVEEALYHLRSVVVIESYPHFFHKSFSDFICDPSRCTDRRYLIDTKEQHEFMAVRCLNLMASSLRRGIPEADLNTRLGVEPAQGGQTDQAETPLVQVCPPELKYACLCWLWHTSEGPRKSQTLHDALERFTSRCLLWWLEVWSWLKPYSWSSRELIDIFRSKDWNVRMCFYGSFSMPS